MGENELAGTKMEPLTWNWSLILRILAVIGAIVTIIMSVLGLIAFFDDFPAGLVINLYLIIFSLLIIGAEFRMRIVTDNFEFLKRYPGRGGFYVFVGTMCFIYASDSVFNVICGIIQVLNGGLHIAMVITNGEAYIKEKEQYAAKGAADSELEGAAAG